MSNEHKSIKICLIGPGIMSIPPTGWGAVEILIWDYSVELSRYENVSVDIINTKNTDEIIKTVNDNNYDFVHLHYDVYYYILDKLNAKHIGFTSHYPYISNSNMRKQDNYNDIYKFMLSQNKYHNFILSKIDMEHLHGYKSINKQLSHHLENGIDSSLFKLLNKPIINKGIYLGKINKRKKQHMIQGCMFLDFVGDIDKENKSCKPRFDSKKSNYLGPWTRQEVYNNLTNYCCLVLLSDGEADSLVIKEALVCGLSVIASPSIIDNLPNANDKPFLRKCNGDSIYVLEMLLSEMISENSRYRKEILDYGKHFDIKTICNKYINTVLKIINTH